MVRVKLGRPMKSQKAPTRLAKVEKKVNKILNSTEPNYKDTTVNTNISYDADNATLLSNISISGDGTEGTRQGRWVTPTRLEVRGAITRAVDTTNQPPAIVRMLVIQAKQRFTPSSSSAGGTTNILQSQGTATTPYQPFDINNRRHYTVLYDKTFTSGFATSASGFAQNYGSLLTPMKRNIKLSRRIQWQDDSTTTEGGQIYVLFYSNVVSTAVEPAFTGVFRLHYVDK